jgi:hypothetical protein
MTLIERILTDKKSALISLIRVFRVPSLNTDDADLADFNG